MIIDFGSIFHAYLCVVESPQRLAHGSNSVCNLWSWRVDSAAGLGHSSATSHPFTPAR